MSISITVHFEVDFNNSSVYWHFGDFTFESSNTVGYVIAHLVNAVDRSHDKTLEIEPVFLDLLSKYIAVDRDIFFMQRVRKGIMSTNIG